MAKKDRGEPPVRSTDEPHPTPGNASLGRYRQTRTGEPSTHKVPEGEAYQQSGTDLPQRQRPIEEMSRAELVEIARQSEIEVDESMSRDDLIAALRVTPDLPGGSR